MPVFSQNPKRRISALVILILLMILFYFFYNYMTTSYSTDPLLLFLLLGFSVVLLIAPIAFESKQKTRPEDRSSTLFEDKPEKLGKQILRNCPKCKMLLPGNLLKCPNCGISFRDVMGLGKDVTKMDTSIFK